MGRERGKGSNQNRSKESAFFSLPPLGGGGGGGWNRKELVCFPGRCGLGQSTIPPLPRFALHELGPPFSPHTLLHKYVLMQTRPYARKSMLRPQAIQLLASRTKEPTLASTFKSKEIAGGGTSPSTCQSTRCTSPTPLSLPSHPINLHPTAPSRPAARTSVRSGRERDEGRSGGARRHQSLSAKKRAIEPSPSRRRGGARRDA